MTATIPESIATHPRGEPFDAGRAKRPAHGIDVRAVEQSVVSLLHAIGENPARPGLAETPARVARAWLELAGGYAADPADVLTKTFHSEGHDGGLVLVRSIPFFSLCEHHMLPFAGSAAIAYLPSEERGIVGLSKLARLVRGFSARLQVQERLGNQIADAINDKLRPLGVAVVLRAEHFCMSMRGVKAPGSVTVTSHLRGLCKEDASSRSEVLNLIGAER